MAYSLPPLPDDLDNVTPEQRKPLIDARIEHLLDSPLCDDSTCVEDLEKLLIYKGHADFGPLRTMIKRIYDLTESGLRTTSNANSGMLGTWNKRSTKRRKKKFWKRVKGMKPGRRYVRIHAEGDSWFQFPIFINDTIDWLKKRKDYLVYSDAYGGDWLTNILYEEQYIQGLTTSRAEVMLISGGGNDLVGNYRLSTMINQADPLRKYRSPEEITSTFYTLTADERQAMFAAQEFIGKEFYALIKTFELQYKLFFTQLLRNESKMKHLLCVTQGYDFPIPRSKRGFGLRTPFQPMVNWLLDSGRWLHQPLMISGVSDAQDQANIMRLMLFEFNEMLVQFSQKHAGVFHIDSRGLTSRTRDWYDELHLKGRGFKQVARAFEYVIDNHETLLRNGDKVIRTVDH